MQAISKQWNPDRRAFLKGTGGTVLASMLHAPISSAQEGVGSNRKDPASARKVIIDTDPGVDDAFALLLAMRSPELKIEAITAVAGNGPIEQTLSNALRMVEVAERTEIPVARGAASPLIRRLFWSEENKVHGNNGLGGAEFPVPRTQPVKDAASNLICRVVRENPGEITIIGIGPLTNVALALREDPELSALIPRIVLMGGAVAGGNATPAAEFNFWADPEAASIVFDSGIPITMVGLDVTMKVELTPNYIQQLEAGHGKVCQAAAQIARKLTELYRREGRVTGKHMHDPLAVATFIRPDIVDLEPHHVEIETAGVITAGESVAWREGRALSFSGALRSVTPDRELDVKPYRVNAQVALGVHPERFFELFINRMINS